MRVRKWQAAAAGAALIAALAGCSGMGYFIQAASGQMSLLGEARPISEWAGRFDAPAKLKERLATAQAIRRFAVKELSLPDNDSYTRYADLKRPYALWNVVAAPELSLSAKTWCFPIAGCVSYKGYYDKKAAETAAAELRLAGYEVEVDGVSAYSTLGWFSDPLLSTFIHRPEPELAGLIFHELAHQVVYAPGDTQFNESFASAVEEAGVERWLARAEGGGEAMRKAWRDRQERRTLLRGLLLSARDRLLSLYESDASDEIKRRIKKETLARLKSDYQELKARWGGFSGYDRWFESSASNAGLSSLSAYHDHVGAFRELMIQSKSMAAFYRKAGEIAKLEPAARGRRLKALSLQAESRAIREIAEAPSGLMASGNEDALEVK